MSSLEKISLYYILGSLVTSLLWLGLGNFGLLNFQVALGLGIVGGAYFFAEVLRHKKLILLRLVHWKNNFTLSEKLLSVFLLIILLLWSTRSVESQAYSDTLITHLVLPNFYIARGEILTYPYHIHSYFPQNTEMLVMWALLLKSEVAAALLMWGFLVAFILLVWGFLKQYTNNFVALLTIFTFISAPVFTWFSTTIKNDFPVGLFLFAHYCVLVKVFNKRESNYPDTQKWVLLAGILCGGAIGHKLIALPVAAVSSLMLIISDLYYKKQEKKFNILTTYWFAGLTLSIAPWFIRTYLATGNPVYPYLTEVFGNGLIKPWHTAIEQGSSIALKGWSGIVDFFQGILGLRYTNGLIQTPDWGPTIFFVFMVLFYLFRKFPAGFKLCFISAFLSWFLMLTQSLEIRYQIGFLTFMICVPFALSSNVIFNMKLQKFFKLIVVLTIFLSFSQTFIYAHMPSVLRSSCGILFSGYSIGSYKTVDFGMDNLRWMCYLIQSRTKINEGVLYAGISYAYGLNRSILFSSDLDRQIIADIAEKSQNSEKFKENLIALGIKHVLISSDFFKSFKDHPVEELRIHDNELKKIQNLIHQHMQLRFVTPNKNVFWFSFKTDDNFPEIVFKSDDAINYSSMYVDQARLKYLSGDFKTAREMLELITNLPIHRLNKVYAYTVLSLVYDHMGDKSSAEEILISSLNIAPDRPEPYLDLALFYSRSGEQEKIRELVQQGIHFGGLGLVKRSKKLSKYLN